METNRKDQNQPELEENEALQEQETPVEAPVETEEESPVEVKKETPAEKVETPSVEKNEKKSLGKMLRSNKFKRGGMATLMTVVFIAIVIVFNILVGLLTSRFPSLNLDLTAQKINTLSDQAERVAGEVQNDTTIYLIGAEERYRKDNIYASYGLHYSQVANLAEKLQEASSKISVEFIDPDTNPGFISQYSAENLMTGDVLVRTEKRYKVLSLTDLFGQRTDSSTGSSVTYSKADSALAAAIEVVNMDEVPVVAMATGHGEMLGEGDTSAFRSLLEQQNFEIREINILTDEIPEDTQILMIPTPTTDYTAEELDKLRAYLNDETREQQLGLFITFYAKQPQLPNLNSFLEEWGISVGEGMVVETDTSRMAAANASFILADASDEVIGSEYSNLVVAMSRPITLLFEGNADIKTQALWTTSDTAYVYFDGDTDENPETSQQNVAAISAKYASVNGKNLRRNLVVFGSTHVFTDTFISATAYGDSTYISDLMKYCTGTDGSKVSVYTETVQTNVRDVAASQGTIVLLGLGVFTVGIPLAILVAGLVIFLKRRHL